MRKVLSLLIVLVVFSSCESDVKFSDPGFQGRKDNFTWRADVTSASISPAGDYLIINGYRGLEQVDLNVPLPANPVTSLNPIVYTLGPDEDAFATYSYEDQGLFLLYTTDSELGNGEIILEEYDPIVRKISGKFKFNARYEGESTIVPANVNYQEAVFYKVPLF